MKICTVLALIQRFSQAITDLDKKMSSLKIPFTLHHGTGDRSVEQTTMLSRSRDVSRVTDSLDCRVTSYKGSEKLFKEASSVDKEIKLYDGVSQRPFRVGLRGSSAAAIIRVAKF